MIEPIEHVDRPRPGAMILIMLLFFALMAGFCWVVAGGMEDGLRQFLRFVLITFHLVIAGVVVWVNASTAYGWTDDALAIRQGWRSRIVPLTDIESIKDGEGSGEFFVDGYANRAFRRLVINLREGRPVVITPTNPEQFRDEILRRRDAARRNSR